MNQSKKIGPNTISNMLSPRQRRLLRKALLAEIDFLSEEQKDAERIGNTTVAIEKSVDIEEVCLIVTMFCPEATNG